MCTNHEKKGDKHIDMIEINLERICLYRGIPCKIFEWTIRAIPLVLKILDHIGYINSVIYEEMSSAGIALILLWV